MEKKNKSVRSKRGLFTDLEETLRQSEERHKAIVETSLDGIYQVDTSGKLIFVNDSLAKTFGYKREELLGKHFSSLMSAEALHKMAGLVQRTLSGEDIGDEVTVQHRDGHDITVSFSSTPLRVNGKVIGLTVILRDISERKTMEETLRKQAHDLGKRVKEIGCIYNISEIISKHGVSVKEMLQRIVGVIPSGWQYPEIACARISLGDQEFITKNFGVTNWKQSSGIIVHSNRAGTVEVCYLERKPEMDEGPFLREERVLLDTIAERLGRMTERKRAEEELSKSEAEYRSLIETAGAGVATTNLKGELVLVNGTLCRMIGYSQEELLGRNFADFLHPDDKNEVLEIFAQRLAAEKEQPHLEFRGIRKDGHSVWCYSTPTAIVHGDETVGFSAIIYDITERKKVEKALRKSIQLLNDTGEMAKVGGWELDLATKEVLWTEEVARIHGVGTRYKMSLEEAIDFYAPESIAVFEETLKKTSETGEPYDLESLFIPSGSKDKVWVRSIGKAIYSGGKIVKLAGTFQNIDKHKRAQEALRDSEEKWRSLAESSPDYIMLLDLDLTILFINRTVPDLTKEEVIGTPAFKYAPPEFHQTMADCYKRVAESGKPDTYTTVYRTKEGESRWFEVRIGPVFKNGQVVAVISSSTDVTERKQAEEALRVSEERFRNVLDNSLDMVYKLNLRTGSYDYVSPSTEKILGYSPEEFAAFTIEEGRSLAHPDDLGRLDENVIELVTSKASTVSSIEYRIKHKELGYRWVSDSRSVIYDDEDNPVAVVGNLRDITVRKEAEEALRQSEERFHRVLDNAIDMIYWLNLKTGEYDYVSPSSEKIIGYTPDEMRVVGIVGGRSLVHPDDGERVDENVIDLIMNAGDRKAPSAIEYRVAHKELGYRWFFDNRSIVYDGDEPVAIVGSLRDVTERKRTEEELWSARERLQRMFDSVKDGVSVTDLQGIITDVNPKGLEMYRGSTKEELIGKSAFELIVPEERGKAMAQLQMVLEQGTTGLIEHNLVRSDGSKYLVELNASVLQDISGNATGFVAVLRDITERKLTERRLEFLSRIIDQANDAITVTNLSYEITYINDAAQRMFGYPLEELVGKSPDIFNIEPSAASMQNEIYKAVSSGKTFLGPALNKRKDGSTFVCEFKVFPLYEHGDIVAYAAFQRDVSERKQIEEALRESEKKYRALFESMLLGVVYQSADGAITSANPAAERILGLTIDQMHGRTSIHPRWRSIHEDGSDFPGETHPAMVALRIGQELRDVVMGVFNPRKEAYTWINISAVPQFRPGEDKPYQVYTMFEDITERKRAEEALAQSEEWHRALVETAGTGGQMIAVLQNTPNGEAGIVFANDTVSEVLGYSPAEIRSMSAWDIFEPSEFSAIAERYRLRQRGEEVPNCYETTLLRKDGTALPIEASLSTMTYRGEVATVVYAKDVTERRRVQQELNRYRQHLEELVEERTNNLRHANQRLQSEIAERWRAEEALRASEERLRNIVESIPIPVVISRMSDGGIMYGNRQFVLTTGLSLEELAGRKIWDFYDSPTEHKDVLSHLLREAGITEREVRGKKADGTTFWAIASVRPLKFEGNDAVLTAFYDITTRKKVEEELGIFYQKEKDLRRQLEEEMKRRVEFTRTLAHELKTPLTPVLLSSEELVAMLKDETSLRLAKSISRGASNLSSRIDELLDLAKGEIDILKLKREYIDVLKLLQEVVDEVSTVPRSRGQKLIWEPPTSLPQVWADKVRVRQIVMNLLNNAFKFTPRRGQITIRGAKGEEGNLVIEVSDTGPGIKEEDQERLFKPYDRLQGDRERLSGLGLGLALCKTLVELHGGQIWLKSSPGKGSTFGFSLPLGAHE